MSVNLYFYKQIPCMRCLHVNYQSKYNFVITWCSIKLYFGERIVLYVVGDIQCSLKMRLLMVDGHSEKQMRDHRDLCGIFHT